MFGSMPKTLGPCPECAADRLVRLSFQVARLDADDEARPEVAAMRPIAKCGGCGALVYVRARQSEV